MADLDYYGADYGAEEPSRVAEAARNFGLVNWAGALTSVGLAAGLAVWAVDLTMRDVSAVPVIQALDGPMRVAPENPGGRVAPFQGLALSDITSGGSAAPAPEEIVLAPAPVDLEAPAQAARRAAIAAAEAKAKAQTTEVAADDDAPAAAIPDTQTAIAAALEAALSGEGATPEAKLAGIGAEQTIVGASAPAPQVGTAATSDPSEPVTAVAATLASGPGIARSTRPLRRPEGLRAAARAAAPVVPTDAPAAEAGTQVASLGGGVAIDRTRDVDPATILPGTRVVQLGAFDSESIARSEWERLNGRFSAYMADKGRLIQKANSGGRDFWRLRVVGFDDGADARRFCSELLARDAACIPVTVR